MSDARSGTDKLPPAVLIGKYACLGAIAGLLAGMVEAGYLLGHPRPPCLLQPNVTSAIWFLGPWVDGVVGGCIGLGTGWAMAIVQRSFLCHRVAQSGGAPTKMCHGHLGRAPSRAGRPWHAAGRTLFGPTHGGEILAKNTSIYGIAIQSVRAHLAALVVIIACIGAALTADARMDNKFAAHVLKAAAILITPMVAHRLGRSLHLKTLVIAVGSAFLLLLTGVAVYLIRPSLQINAAAADAPPLKGKPNIILITLDTVRADHLSLYGYSRLTTPNIDRWARGGVVFRNAIAPTSWTLASHASMFTGLLPHQHGADWQIPLNTSRWTLADVLRSWGYETAGFTSNIGYGEAGWGLDRGFDLYEDNRFSLLHNLQTLEVGRRIFDPLYRRWVRPESFERRTAFEVDRDIFDWFHRRSSRPFFLFINYFDAHDPYLAPRDYAHQFGDAPHELFRMTKIAFTTSGVVFFSDRDRSELMAGYDNSLASLDHSVGDLLDSLAHLPQWDNTVVIITSDHGEAFGEHGTYYHGINLYSESVHVPLIIFGPGIPQGLEISRVVSTQDLFATALQFAEGGAAPFAPTSLQRHWTPGLDPGESDESVISELTPKYGFTNLWPQMSLRTQDWEYIRDSRGKEELYRWTQDPGEQVNLAGSAEYRYIVDGLRARLCNLVGDSRRPWQGPQYLSALDDPQRPFVNFAASLAEPASGPRVPLPRIGDVQDRFPPRAVVSPGTLEPADNDLLQSLPYH